MYYINEGLNDKGLFDISIILQAREFLKLNVELENVCFISLTCISKITS